MTAVEHNAEIAAIYQSYYPDDIVIVADAHQYILDHYKEFDFIWTSPPCPTHSEIRRCSVNSGQNKPLFPDMNLWQEIVFLEGHYKGLYTVENVKPYYEPFVKPTIELDRHLFWSNFKITRMDFDKGQRIEEMKINEKHFGYDLSNIKTKHRKDQLLRNLVNPEVGLHILECALSKSKQRVKTTLELF